MQQEIILGIGGVRVLQALGISRPSFTSTRVTPAFVVLQRIREFIDAGASFDDGARGSAADDGLHDAYAGGRGP